ncbi:IclR family transcriptional regulator [Actinomadura sp. B10D3]|uniref:IclR family transcriptional regulator n=1 Tax=Actinomadura sp. B10D3 TaxID=3153557 RepID=UPI00325CF40F
MNVVRRVVSILESFSDESPELGIAELARSTQLSTSTVHRLVTSLEQHGILDHGQIRGKYRLGLRLFQFGELAISKVSYVDRASDVLAELTQTTGETAHMGVLRNDLALYVAKVEGWRSLRLPSQVGKMVSPHCCAMGKCLLAFLDDTEAKRIIDELDFARHTERTVVDAEQLIGELAQTRASGWAYDRGELELELACVAAPIFDYTNKIVAAVSVSGPFQRVCGDSEEDYRAAVVRAGREISRRLGAR